MYYVFKANYCKYIRKKHRPFEFLAAYHSFIWAYGAENGDQLCILATIAPPVSICGAL